MTAYQYPLCLPPNHAAPPDPERIREQLAAAVEQANAETDPAERVALFAELDALRRRLKQLEGNK